MAGTNRIPRDQLAEYLDNFSSRFLGDEGRPRSVDVEVMAMDLGDQHPVEGARLLGITYDTHRDYLELSLDSGDHRVFQPHEVWAVEDADGFINAIHVVCYDGLTEIVTVKRVGLRRRDD